MDVNLRLQSVEICLCFDTKELLKKFFESQWPCLFFFLLFFPITVYSNEASYAFIPYLNYDTTQSWSYGSAFEKESENLNIDTYLIDAELTKDAKLRLITNYQTHFNNKWGISFKTGYSSFYESFYGFGISTKVNDIKKMKRQEFYFQSLVFYQLSNAFSFGPFIEFKQRKENPDYQFDHKRFFPDENAISLGGSFLYDTRNSKLNPTDGYKHEFQLTFVPDGLNQLEGQTTFSQLKLDLRKYTPFYHTVLATRLALGTTIGEPSYSYKYRLGGNDLLRGYQSNRFIGNKFMTMQVEDRINIYNEYIAATTSYEIGSVTSNLYDKRRSSYGLGIRLAMPPDWSNMLSLNFGFGNDQENIVMDFSENF
jgi:outer membrane protein assembly factor BamA